MNTQLTPIICVGSLACMITAGASHWWSVRQFTTAIESAAPTLHAPAIPTPQPTQQSTPQPSPQPTQLAAAPAANEPEAPQPSEAAPTHPATPPVGEPIAMQQQFYQELLSEMQQLRGQNRDLLNQVAETNRDLMNLEFRVDTHSDQFRPLPVAEEAFNASFGTSFDDSPGLLPPRAEPVILPSAE